VDPTRHLIVNADDFGLCPGINRGILHAHQEGIVTSTSLMVRPESAAEAATLARDHPHLSVGLHLDLGEWRFDGETWRAVYLVTALESPAAVQEEVERQLAKFRALTGRDPTHLDSHQHVHRSEPVLSIVRVVARCLDVPLRGEEPSIRYCGEFYGQSDKGYPCPERITVEALTQIVAGLTSGITELGCHPGEATGAVSCYHVERELECTTLCDPRTRRALEEAGVMLCSFLDAPGYGLSRRIR
jgi:predicted glycoside hydrolase/deacetylase ChbG (UPF0249 family)